MSIKSESELNQSNQSKNVVDSVHFVPIITLGVPSAHGLGFTEGGLRGIFKGIDDPIDKQEWMHMIQDADIKKIIQKKLESDVSAAQFASIFGSKIDVRALLLFSYRGQRIDSLCLCLIGILLYTAVVIFHIEWCTRKPALVFFYHTL